MDADFYPRQQQVNNAEFKHFDGTFMTHEMVTDFSTLLQAWEGRAYDYGMANLKSMGFPVGGLNFDPNLVSF